MSNAKPYTFPPFPPAPPDTEITPFSQFRECGIQLELGAGDGDIEVDGRGIPTVELEKKHDNDEAKSDARREGKKKHLPILEARPQNTTRAPGKPAQSSAHQWWQDWEEGEYLRSTVVEPSSTPQDRMNKAVYDFSKYRKWPTHQTIAWHSWEKFRFYIGVLHDDSEPRFPGRSLNKDPDFDAPGNGDDDDVMSDEEEFAGQGPTVHNTKYPEPEREEKPAPMRHDFDVLKDLPKPTFSLEEKMLAFLADPERGTKVFLSSYMRARGIMWMEQNLVYVPRLLIFFYNFILRSAIFDPDRFPYESDGYPQSQADQINSEMRQINEGLTASLAIAEEALQELPLTSLIAQWVEPYSFSAAAKAHWGRKADGYKTVVYDPPAEEIPQSDEEPVAEVVNDNVDVQEGVEVRRCVVEVTGIPKNEDNEEVEQKDGYTEAGRSPKRPRIHIADEQDDIEAQVAQMMVPELDEELMDAKAVIEDNLDVEAIIRPTWMKFIDPQKGPPLSMNMDVVEDDEPGPSTPSGSDTPSPNTPAEEQGWTADTSTGFWDSSGYADSWDTTTTSVDAWVATPVRTLQDLLGESSTLSDTHAPGLVESSLRRIKAVLKPGEGVGQEILSKEVQFDSKDPEEMEAQLARRFVRVVLEPWLYTDVRQEVGVHSLGRVERRMPGPYQPAGLPGKGLELTDGQRITKVHNILSDEITILIDAQHDKATEVFDVLTKAIGMGLGGCFVELARVGDLKDDGNDSDSDIEMDDWDDRVDMQGLDDGRRYWYLEEQTMVYPSFWLPLGLKKRWRGADDQQA